MNILLVGVGGQGIILTSKILAAGLILTGADVKMSEIHGMSQRGGTVTTQIRYGERVCSPQIGEGDADFIVAFEKLEALRALPFLKEGGHILADDWEIPSMPVLTGAARYAHNALDDIRACGASVTVIPASRTAAELGNIRAQNIVLLGALTRRLGLPEVDWKALVAAHVPPKAVDINVKGFEAGWAGQ